MTIEQLFENHELVPVVVQDDADGTVLGVCYANRLAVSETLRTKTAVFWSRSRNELWRKGETSGNVAHIVGVEVDCDNDALLYRVRPTGSFCHTGETSCFHQKLED